MGKTIPDNSFLFIKDSISVDRNMVANSCTALFYYKITFFTGLKKFFVADCFFSVCGLKLNGRYHSIACF